MSGIMFSALAALTMSAASILPLDEVDYLRDKWRKNVADMTTGKDAETLKHELTEKAAEWGKTDSFQIVKARMFAYLCDEVAIDVSGKDWFPVHAQWTRHTYSRHPVWDIIHNRSRAIADAKYPGLKWGGYGWGMYLDFDHSAPDWDDALKLGFKGMEKRLVDNWKDDEFHRARRIAIDGVYRFLDRLVAQSEKGTSPRSVKVAESLKRLRNGVPVTALDAMEFIYLYWTMSEHFEAIQVRTLGNLDRLLAPFYREDLAKGRITEDEFRDMLRHFWWQWGSLDNYYGQPVYFGGTKADGTTEYNEVSRMLLETVDELELPTPKVHLKIGKSTPDWIWRQALDMMRRQRPLTFIGEEPHWRVMKKYGYTDEQARQFLVWGCYEWAANDGANDTCGGTLDTVKPLCWMLSCAAKKQFDAADFDAFKREYMKRLEAKTIEARNGIYKLQTCLEDVNPSLLFSLATANSMKKGVDALAGGMPNGNNTSIWMIGMGSAVDSLLAVKELVYERRDFTLAQLGALMAADWRGGEYLRLKMQRSKRKWGNNCAEANDLMREVVKCVAKRVNGVPNSRGGIFKASGHSARYHYSWGEGETATPDGRHKGDELSKNIAPTMGVDTEGATALVASFANIDPIDLPGDFPLDMALLPASIKGEEGLLLMRTLIERYFANNGLVIQFNVMGAEMLKDAQAHPEKYENLQVRICGWNVRWNDMPKKEQDAFIRRQEMLVQ